MLSFDQQTFPSKRRKSNLGKEMPPAAVPGVGECRICFEVVPCVKVLDCNHCLCIPCLTKLVEQQKVHEGPSANQKTCVGCPECRQKTDCSQGVASLKTLYFGKIRCDLCLEKKDTDDIWWCQDCLQTICSKCSIKEHSKKGHHISEWNKMEPVKYSIQYLSQVKCARQVSGSSDTNRATVKSFIHAVEKSLHHELQIEPELEDLHYNLISRYGTRFASSTETPPNSPATASFDQNDGAPRLLTKVLQLAGANVLESLIPMLNSQEFIIKFKLSPEEVAKYLRSNVEFIPCENECPAPRMGSISTSLDSEGDPKEDTTFSSNVEENSFTVPNMTGPIEQYAYSNSGLVALRTCREISIYNLNTESVQFIPVHSKLECRCMCFTNTSGELLAGYQSNVKKHEWSLESFAIQKLPIVSIYTTCFDIDPDDHVFDLKLSWSVDQNLLYEIRINELQKVSEIWKAVFMKKKDTVKLKETLVYQKAQSKITMLQVATTSNGKEHHLFVWDEAAFSIMRLTIRDNRCCLATKILTSPSPISFVLDPKRKLWLYDPFSKQLCHSWSSAAGRSNVEFRQVFSFAKYNLDGLWYTPEAIIGLALSKNCIHVMKFKKEPKQDQNVPKPASTAAASNQLVSHSQQPKSISQSIPSLPAKFHKEISLKRLTLNNQPSTSSKP